jgi:hypothetical protein
MNTYIIWMIIQSVCLIINSYLLLYNYHQYRKYRLFIKRRYIDIGLIAFTALNLIWCVCWLIYDTGKASGQW